MAIASNIVINDGAATPVAHTFSPSNKDQKGVLFFEQTVPVVATQVNTKKIGYKQTRGNLLARQQIESGKLTLMVYIPTAEATGTSDSGYPPPPRVAYKHASRIEADLPERGTKQERKDLRVLTANLLLNSQIVAAWDDLISMNG